MRPGEYSLHEFRVPLRTVGTGRNLGSSTQIVFKTMTLRLLMKMSQH